MPTRKGRKNRNRRRTRNRKLRRRQRGGSLPIPRGSIASMSLDAKDEYAVPVLVRRELAEEELLDE
jgi:hypothetical protein